MPDTINRMKEGRNDLSLNERKACDYVLKNPEKASMMTISELAKSAKSSPSTITRMCASLGFKGYKDFIKALLLDVANLHHKEAGYEEIGPEDGEEAIRSKSESNLRAAAKEAVEALDEKSIRKAAGLLHDAAWVLIYGEARDEPAGRLLEEKLREMGKKAVWEPTLRDLALDLSSSLPAPAVVLLESNDALPLLSIDPDAALLLVGKGAKDAKGAVLPFEGPEEQTLHQSALLSALYPVLAKLSLTEKEGREKVINALSLLA